MWGVAGSHTRLRCKKKKKQPLSENLPRLAWLPDTCLDSEDNRASNNLKWNDLLHPPSCPSEAALSNHHEAVVLPDISQWWFDMGDLPFPPFKVKSSLRACYMGRYRPCDVWCLAGVILGGVLICFMVYPARINPTFFDLTASSLNDLPSFLSSQRKRPELVSSCGLYTVCV